MAFLTNLFDTSGFPTRWQCGSAWADDPWIGWLHILSDLGVWSAYLAIPVVLVYFILRRKDLPFRKIFLLFGAFILACGTTHLMEAIIFWWPAYRLAGVLKLFTAVVSWATVVALVPVVPRVLAMRSPEELEREVTAKDKAEQALQQANADLEVRIQDRTAELAAANAVLQKEREWFQTTLKSIGDAVIATDNDGKVTFMNPVAQTLTAWKEDEAQTQQLEAVFKIVNEETRKQVESPAARALKEGVIVGLANHTILIARNGTERPIDDSAAPLRDASGHTIGAVLVFRDISERKNAEVALADRVRLLKLSAEVGKALTHSDTLRDTLQRCSEAMVQHLNGAFVRIWTLDPKNEVLELQASAGMYTHLDGPHSRVPVGQFKIGLIAQERKPHLTNTVANDPRVSNQEWAKEQGMVAFAGYPLLVENRLVGVVAMFARQPLSDAALDGMASVANGIAVAIERKKGEERLWEQRELLRTTLSSIGDAVIATDIEGRVTFLNPVAESLTGWMHEEATQLSLDKIFTIVNEQSRCPVENPVTKVLRDGDIVGLANHTILIAKDGTERPIDDSAAPIRDEGGNLRGVVLVFRDITERKQAENSLRHTEAQQRFLADVSAALVGSLHYQSIVRQVADQTVPTLGDFCFFDVLTADEQIERVGWKHIDPQKTAFSDKVQDFVPPKDFESHPVSRVLRTGHAELFPEVTDEFLQAIATSPEHLEFLRELRVCSMMSVPMSVGERRLGVLTFAYGESLRHHTADELHLASEIARRLALVMENAKLFNQLREADRKKNEFLAVLAHELRNPLAPITTALALMRMTDGKAEDLVSLREMMERQVQQMTHLIDDLLDVSRITSGKIVLRNEHINLSGVVRNALEASRPLIDNSRHDLAVTLPDREIQVQGDRTRLAQVLSNLLANSAKYTPEGGRIWLSVSRSDHMAVIRVRDTGVGIPSDMLPMIFEMFTQVDRNLGRSQGGLGIGLSLVRSLVAMHGGTVEAKSDGPGLGSEFVVRLPLLSHEVHQQADNETRAAVSQQGADAHRKLRVLVVDDNKDAAVLLERLLKAIGYEVRITHDGPGALEAAVTFRPNFVLLDIGMPGMSGHDVARRMRQMPETKDAVLVAQTGWGQDEDRRLSQEAGFNAHLVKPVDIAELRKLLVELPTNVN